MSGVQRSPRPATRATCHSQLHVRTQPRSRRATTGRLSWQPKRTVQLHQMPGNENRLRPLVWYMDNSRCLSLRLGLFLLIRGLPPLFLSTRQSVVPLLSSYWRRISKGEGMIIVLIGCGRVVTDHSLWEVNWGAQAYFSNPFWFFSLRTIPLSVWITMYTSQINSGFLSCPTIPFDFLA